MLAFFSTKRSINLSLPIDGDESPNTQNVPSLEHLNGVVPPHPPVGRAAPHQYDLGLSLLRPSLNRRVGLRRDIGRAHILEVRRHEVRGRVDVGLGTEEVAEGIGEGLERGRRRRAVVGRHECRGGGEEGRCGDDRLHHD